METKDILKQLRLEKNLSMDELCEKLNNSYNLKITKSMISRWENGQASPNNSYLSAYAKFFNIDLNYLAGLTAVRRPLNFINSETETQDDIITTYNLTPDELIEYEKIKSVNRALFFNDNRGSDEDKEELDDVLKKIFIKSLLNKRNKEK